VTYEFQKNEPQKTKKIFELLEAIDKYINIWILRVRLLIGFISF